MLECESTHWKAIDWHYSKLVVRIGRSHIAIRGLGQCRRAMNDAGGKDVRSLPVSLLSNFSHRSSQGWWIMNANHRSLAIRPIYIYICQQHASTLVPIINIPFAGLTRLYSLNVLFSFFFFGSTRGDAEKKFGGARDRRQSDLRRPFHVSYSPTQCIIQTGQHERRCVPFTTDR